MNHTAVAAAFRRITEARPGYTPWVGFVVKDGTAVYTLEPSDRDDLPFTHKLIGNHGPVYGYWAEVSGRAVPVRRSGWYSARGVLGRFHTATPDASGADTLDVKGWAVTGAAGI